MNKHHIIIIVIPRATKGSFILMLPERQKAPGHLQSHTKARLHIILPERGKRLLVIFRATVTLVYTLHYQNGKKASGNPQSDGKARLYIILPERQKGFW